MTGRIINLRQARKAKARDGKRAEADANAARHGLTKSERATARDEKSRDGRMLDGHKLDDGDHDADRNR